MSILKRSVIALLLTPLALGIAIPGPASAAPAHRPISLLTTQEGRTIWVTGSHFTPGAIVTLAVLNTHTWQVLAAGSTRSEPARYPCPPSANAACGQPDPSAGRLRFQTTLHQRVNSSALVVLYRSGTRVGFGHVQ
jgi:hypothetical protein